MPTTGDQTTTDTNAAAEAAANNGWMNDVQRALALMIVGTLILAAVMMVMRLVWSAAVDDILDVTKNLLSNLQNMALIALGFFFGSTIAKMKSDAGQQKTLDKLTGTIPPTTPAPPTTTAAPAAVTTDAVASATLTNGQRTYYDTLTDDETKKKFLGMSDAERNAVIGKV